MSQENKPNIQGTSKALKQLEKNAELEKKRKEADKIKNKKNNK